MKSLDSFIYQLNPPRNFSIYLYPGSTSIVKIMNNSRSFTFKNHTLSDIVSRKIISKDTLSTRFGDRLYFSYIVSRLKPKRFRILSSGIKPINGSCVEISIILLRVEQFGFIVSG